MISRRDLLPVICLCLFTPVTVASPPTVPTSAREILELAAASVEQVVAIQVEFEQPAGPGSGAVRDKLAKRDQQGRSIQYFAKYFWDVRGLYRLQIQE